MAIDAVVISTAASGCSEKYRVKGCKPYGYGIPNMLNARLLLSAPSAKSEIQSGYSLFPVPFTGSPWIKNSLNNPEQVTMEILSVSGQVLFTRNLNFNSSPAMVLSDFDALQSGVYFIRITGASGQQVLRAVKI
jgi:hypothetical protein